jgi:energy-coupling factor transport system ATP-binding protein
MIRMKGVSLTYPGPNGFSLDNVNLEVEPGEFLAVLGRNGSGKSTLARLLAGLLLPDAGEILIDDLDTRDRDAAAAIHQKVAMLFSNPDNQMVSSIVEEDVAFGPENLGLPPQEIEARVQAALSAVRMEDYRKYPPHLLSGGQKQRIAIAGVLALKPSYMILDEPTSMLDPQGRAEVVETLVRLNREEGTGIVLITHFTEEAALASRVLVLGHRAVALSAPPEEVLNRVEDLYALGLEAPDVVLLAGALRERGFDVPPVLEGEDLINYLCRSNLKRSDSGTNAVFPGKRRP